VRSHQHSAGAAEKGDTVRDGTGGREALGRSRGGLTTKIHLLADQYRRPLVVATSPGQRGDSPMFEPLMAGLRLPRTVSAPRTRPDRVLGDKACSSSSNRAVATRHDKRAAIFEGTVQVASIRIWLRNLTGSENSA
jgi:hypothetical protein